MNKKTVSTLIIVLLLSLSSCMEEKPHISLILDKAGANKVELQKFLNNYKNDPLKLKAAEFLITGMEGRFSYDLLVKGPEKQTVGFNLYHPKINRKNLIYLLDSLHYYVTDTIAKDIETVSSEYLIKNHELAFEIWQTKPWSKNYSFDIFCEFILPYRIGNESLESDWRTYFQEKYLPILDTMQGNNQVKKVFQFVKNDIKKWFWYSNNTIDLKPTMDLDEVLNCHKGNCVDLANVYLYALRAVGVAAAVDYIPLWGRTDYGHCELVYWDENNQPQRLQTGEWLQTPPPKVYRQFYSNQQNNLVNKIENPNDIPLHLTEKTYCDVTNEYTKTSTVKVKPEKQPENGILYLNVFNAGRWQPIAWSDSITAKTGNYIFKNMGRNIVYLPSVYAQKMNIPNGKPFIIGDEWETIPLGLRAGSLISMVFPTKGIENELFYWDNKWKTVGQNGIMDDSLRFENVPTNTLYRLVNPNGNQMERIFTYKNNKRRNW